jgi:hypothetical protein
MDGIVTQWVNGTWITTFYAESGINLKHQKSIKKIKSTFC